MQVVGSGANLLRTVVELADLLVGLPDLLHDVVDGALDRILKILGLIRRL